MKGRNVPKKKKKDAIHRRVNAGCFKGRINSIISSFLGRGANLDLTVKLAITSMPRIMNAQTLIVQGKPIFGISLLTMMGKITPPSDEPEAMIPNAAARFLKNHVPTELMAE